jgi:glycosyltransferase involved in cell wall biosynthesis
MRVMILPSFSEEDKGDGGIRRVVEAQLKYLPAYGISVVTKNPDIVAVHGGAVYKGLEPTVAHCHGLYWSDYAWSQWAHELNRSVITTMRIADAVTAPSEWVANILKRGMWINPTVIYHGIDTELWTPGENHGYVLWNKTRVDAICDPQPMDKLASLAPRTSFVSTYGAVGKNVHLTGRLSFIEAKKLIENAGVYLCTARETFGIGTLEAMACGVPILGWAWGGQTEIVRHKVDGWLAEPGNYDQLLEGLYYCIENRDLLGHASRERVIQDFDWPSAIKHYADVYKHTKDITSTPVKVTVLVTCYNLAKLLPRALDSIKRQTFKDWECIVVDDASPDNTKEIAQKYIDEDPRFRIHTNKENMYLSGALNEGVKVAKGQYILPIDADNELSPNALELLSSALDKDRELMIVYGTMEIVEEPEGKRWVSGWPPKDFKFGEQLSHHNQISSTALYRKRVWQTIGGYRRRCRTAEDADFWCRATSYGFKPAKVTDAITLIYHNRTDSMSHVETDWPWNQWYTWNSDPSIAPITAPLQRPNVPLYEPLKVSVIIPVGPGHEKYVHDAIDSVNGQTLLGWECIVVNDSGADLEYIPPFVKLLSTNGIGCGPSVARNIGIRASKAQLFVPLDADDYLQPNALYELVRAWEKYGGYVYPDWIKQEERMVQSTEDYNCHQVLQRLHHAVTAIYPKQAWEDAGGFDEKLQAWEDWDFVISINNAGYCGTRLPMPLFQYRLNSGTRRQSQYEQRELLKQAIYKKWQPYIEGKEQLMACGGCRKGGGVKVAAPAVTATTPNNDPNVVMLEFVKPNSPALTYRGPVTGTMYRFGSDVGHKVRYVYKSDAIEFLRRSEFKLVGGNVEAPVLEAAGPPIRN